MSEDDDKDSKTEEPTERKVQDALDKGNVPLARELVTFGSLAAILLACHVLAEWSTTRTASTLARTLESAGQIRLGNREDATSAIYAILRDVILSILPLVLLIGAGGVLGALIQNVPQAAGERVTPKLSRISMFSGWSRIYSLKGMVEFAKTMLKLLAVMVITGLVLASEAGGIFNTLQSDLVALPSTMLRMVTHIVTILCLVAGALAIFDIAWSRFDWRKGLRMTHQELKEEFRQSEGNPEMRAKARSIARRRRSRNMFAKVPTATMVITNPTHYAVALRYVREEGGAPVVVAKGLDHLALRIRQAASEHDIPIVENRPLARSLYDGVGLDESIPPEFYKAVAEIIHYLQVRATYTAVPARPH